MSVERISFIDDNFEYVHYVITKEYSELAEKVRNNTNILDYYEEEEGFFSGYKITLNNPLTKLYGFNCYVVRFCFANVTMFHNDTVERMCKRMLHNLHDRMKSKGGYFSVRIPTHIFDLVKSFNEVLSDSIFCGGTVEQFIYSGKTYNQIIDGMRVYWADKEDIERNYKELSNMTYDSFERYEGQYHLSTVTSDLAGEIYRKWVEESLRNLSDSRVLISEYHNEAVGYVTVKEGVYAVEGVLSAVRLDKRNLGTYRSMISSVIEYANKMDKALIGGTKFDNFTVQSVWNSLGARPYYSLYNFHYDYR